jgi:hypothetical protein
MGLVGALAHNTVRTVRGGRPAVRRGFEPPAGRWRGSSAGCSRMLDKAGS